MSFITLVYIIFFVPSAIYNYKKAQKTNWKAITINLLITFYLFVTSIENANAIVHSLFSGNFITKNYVVAGVLPPLITFSGITLHLLLSCFLVPHSISLIFRKNKSRRILIKFSPLFWVSNSLIFYIISIMEHNFSNNGLPLLLFFTILSTIIWALIFFAYNSKLMKSFFSEGIQSKENNL